MKKRLDEYNWEIKGAIILPVIYLILLVILKDLDFIVFFSGPFSIFFWLVQWIGFLIGGWIFGTLLTLIFLSLLGYLLGSLLKFLFKLLFYRKER